MFPSTSADGACPAPASGLLTLLGTAFPQPGAVALLPQQQPFSFELGNSGAGAGAYLAAYPQVTFRDNSVGGYPARPLQATQILQEPTYCLIGDQLVQLPLNSAPQAGPSYYLDFGLQHDSPALFSHLVPRFDTSNAAMHDFLDNQKRTSEYQEGPLPYMTPDSFTTGSPDLDTPSAGRDSFAVDPRVFLQSTISPQHSCIAQYPFPTFSGPGPSATSSPQSLPPVALPFTLDAPFGALPSSPNDRAEHSIRKEEPPTDNFPVASPEPEAEEVESNFSESLQAADEPETKGKGAKAKPRGRRRAERKSKASPPANTSRKHVCTVCGMKFLSSGVSEGDVWQSVDRATDNLLLTQHLSRHRYIHVEDGKKPHSCPVPGCTRKFARSDNAKVHATSHQQRVDAEQAKAGPKAAASKAGRKQNKV